MLLSKLLVFNVKLFHGYDELDTEYVFALLRENKCKLYLDPVTYLYNQSEPLELFW